MRQASHIVHVRTAGRGLHDVTREIETWVNASGIDSGLLTLFLRHTSASLLIQENADPDVRRDLDRFFARLVPDGDPLFSHVLEGPDDMPAHVRCALTQTSIGIPVAHGRTMLGIWQGIYIYEHRLHGHGRELVLHLVGE